jgi:dTDP-4-amino-4,6-dideoxygalactose transaminase
VAVIDDAAQAIGSKLGGQYVGTFGDLGIFSFGPFKSIMATRGGALITNSEKTYQNIRRFLPLPNSTDKMCVRALKSLVKFKLRRYSYWILPSNRRSEKVEEEQIENNLAELKPTRMSPMDAAIVQAQLDKLERIVSRRIMLARHLSELLKECEWLEIPRERGEANVFVKYLIYLKTNTEVSSGFRGKMASELIAHLRRLGIEAHGAYAPLHLNEHFSGYCDTQLSVTEDVWKRLVCLPMNPEMSTSDLEFMASSIIGFGLRT